MPDIKKFTGLKVWGFAILLSALISCGSTNNLKDLPIYTIQHDNNTVTQETGSDFLVRLSSPFGTGYRWEIKGCDGKVTPVRDWKVKERHQGNAEFHIFQFHVEGKGSLKLEYVHPWEKSFPPAETFELMIREP
jgi:predicted secreted protein